MASDTTKKTATKKVAETKTTKKVATTKTTAKKTATAKPAAKTTTKKAAATKKTEVAKKTTGKKTTVKSTNARVKKTEPKKVAKTKVEEINLEDLEQNEPDLSRTIVIKPDELNALKVETTNKKKEEEASTKTLLGFDIPAGETPDDKAAHRRGYAKDALVAGIIVAVIDFLAMVSIKDYDCWNITNNPVINYIVTLLGDFVIVFVLTYIVNCTLGKEYSKKGN